MICIWHFPREVEVKPIWAALSGDSAPYSLIRGNGDLCFCSEDLSVTTFAVEHVWFSLCRATLERSEFGFYLST